MSAPTRQRLFDLLGSGHSLKDIADILDQPIGYLAHIIVTPVRELSLDEQIERYLNTSVGYEFHVHTEPRRHHGGVDDYDENPPAPTVKPRTVSNAQYFARKDVASMIQHVLDSPILDAMQLDGYSLNDRVVPTYVQLEAEEYDKKRKHKERRDREDEMSSRTGKGPWTR